MVATFLGNEEVRESTDESSDVDSIESEEGDLGIFGIV